MSRRERTDRHGGMIDRVRAYLSDRRDQREEESARRLRRLGSDWNWEGVADVQSYVHLLEGLLSGNAVSAYHLNEHRRRCRDSVVDLGVQPNLRTRAYADAASAYVLVLERAVQAEEHHGLPREELARNYQDAYAAVRRDGV